MAAYGQRGTPALWPVDRAGRMRAHHLGQIPDMAVGAQIAALLGEGEWTGSEVGDATRREADLEGRICPVPTDGRAPSPQGSPR